jgi:uncharacterized protein YabE (DUF348 family)
MSEKTARPEPGTDHNRIAVRLGAALAALAIVAGLVGGYVATQRTIVIVVDGQSSTLRTHARLVGAALAEAQLTPGPEDWVTPGLNTPVAETTTVVVQRAREVTVQADGRVVSLRTHAATVAQVLAEAGVTLERQDRLTLDGQPVALAAHLATATPPPAGLLASAGSLLPRGRQASPAQAASPLRLVVQRAVPFHLHDGAAVTTLTTVATTVGEALHQTGVPVYLADQVQPPLTTPLVADLHVYVQRARPVTILVDGATIHTRTQAKQVSQVLAEEQVPLFGKDYAQPEKTAAVQPNMTVQVQRVKEEFITEAEPIPYQTVWQPEYRLELDQREITQVGQDGVFKRTIRIVYENGQEVRRLLEREWVDQQPVTKTIAFGTRIVVREMDTPDGKIQYWRTMRVWATWYDASHGGKARDDPRYGYTRTGVWATKGIVAVDPRFIALHTRMYVPGYGLAAAEDTGGAIIGMHIDLAFDEGDPSARHLGWVTIYLLAPPPPTYSIAWILSGYPVEP